MEELKKCPFCGGEAKAKVIASKGDRRNTGFIFEIECKKCRVKLPKQYGIDLELQEDLSIRVAGDDRRNDAINDWNNRV